ncbi:MAG: ATP-binding cassette domain-containing protein [Anaerolineae bacterium]|nr:ATP-binding cassette domain-containing protein [Anaerolineae bacterium]
MENLGLARAEMATRLEETLARFDLGDKRHRSPQTLSGGEQQKLALAAIMARRPPLLVLDEPLSMLDGTAAGELVAHLGRLAEQGTAVVVCEHRHEYFQSLPGLRTMPLGTGQAVLPERGRRPPLPPVSPLQLDVSDLSVSLGERAVLAGLNFEASGGQVVAIVGRNGVGKTTLLRSLAGLQKHKGEISVDGGRPDLGLVFQNANLQIFNASARDEILFRVPNADRALYEWLLAALGLERYEEVPPLLLSEGEKKRVALATVLMRLPRHGVLLDEPSLGQDGAHKEQLIRVARAVADTGRLVIMTTHDLSLAAQADRLLLMSGDGFVADGPPARVLHDERAWARIGLSVPDWIESKEHAGQVARGATRHDSRLAEEAAA